MLKKSYCEKDTQYVNKVVNIAQKYSGMGIFLQKLNEGSLRMVVYS